MSLDDIEQKRELIRLRKMNEHLTATQDNANSTECEKPEEKKVEQVAAEPDYVFLAFARVFSGTLRKGQELFILSPKHNPEDFVGKVKK